MGPMGAANKTAGLWAGLVGIIGAWGVNGICAEAATAAGSDAAAFGPHFNDKGWVQADVHYDCSHAAPTRALASAGFTIGASVKLGSLCVVEGWVAPKSLAGLAAVAGVTRVTTPTYAVHPRRMIANLSARPAATGSGVAINRNGVTIMRADQFVSQTGTSGLGVKVGVQSVGISSMQTIQARGELPSVQVVAPSDGASSPGGDEGTALLEEIHAVAPGAGLIYCGPSTFVEYTSCLSRMVDAGATILVDDLIFPQQDLLSADSSAVQAIEQLLKGNPNVTLFTAGGNYNGSYWEGTYTPVALASLGMQPLTCPASGGGAAQTDYYVTRFDGDPSQVLTVTQSARISVAFAWGDPPDHNASAFDVYWVNADSTKSGCLYSSSASDNQIASNIVFQAGTYTLYIGTPDATPSGKFLKLWIGGDGLTSISKPTAGAVVTPQAIASGAVTIGAVNGSDGIGNGIEPFSSLGPITVLYPELARIQSPVLVAPDGINVDAVGTYFAGILFPDGNFYGTSASAPNAAAVAALILGAFPALTSTQLVAALKSGAAQLGSTVPDATFGYGRIDAMGALGTFPLPTMTSALQDSALTAGQSSPSYSFTVSGAGPLHFSVTSSNTTSIPAAVVPAGSPGVTITPSDCGVTTLTCSLSVMAAAGPGGTVNVTVAALDGANRAASASMKVTVTGTEPPPTSTPPPASTGGSGGGGGAIDGWVIAVLMLGVGTRLKCHLFARGRMVALS